MSFIRTLFVILIFSFTHTACIRAHPSEFEPDSKGDWSYQDIITLDPLEDIDPSADMVALYLRTDDHYLEVRVDFLIFGDQPPYNIEICLDGETLKKSDTDPVNASEVQRDVKAAICITYSGTSHSVILNPEFRDQGYTVSHQIDPISDYITFSIQTPASGNAIWFDRVEARIYHPDTGELIDHIGPVSVNTRLSDQFKANLLLEFWDVLSSPTPASLLRAWDGAHSGPYGGRHGLAHLLKASTQYRIPIYLLDLKNPHSLDSMKMLSGMEMLTDYEETGLVILPRSTWGDPILSRQSLEIGANATIKSGLRISPLIFSPVLDPDSGTTAQFAVLNDPTHLATMNGTKLIPFLGPFNPDDDPIALAFFSNQVDLKGLTLESRRSIFQSAINADPYDLIVLGGSLPHTSWGDAAGAAEAFKYLHDHPWITYPNPADLATMPANSGNKLNSACLNLLCIPDSSGVVEFFPFTQSDPIFLNQSNWQDDLRTKIDHLSNEGLTEQITKSYLWISKPGHSQIENTLAVSNYRLIERLSKVNAWLTDPIEQIICEDFFWGTDCVISSETIYVSLDPSGGLLVFGIVRTDHGPELFIAPSGLYFASLSAPEEWTLSNGPFADPSSHPGARLRSDYQRMYHLDVGPNYVMFTSEDGITKQYSISGDKLTLSIDHLDAELIIPMVWQSAGPATENRISLLSPLASTESKLSPMLTISSYPSSGQLSVSSSNDSWQYLQIPEDPNLNYPPGHYIPFPFTVLMLAGEGPLDIIFEFK